MADSSRGLAFNTEWTGIALQLCGSFCFSIQFANDGHKWKTAKPKRGEENEIWEENDRMECCIDVDDFGCTVKRSMCTTPGEHNKQVIKTGA